MTRHILSYTPAAFALFLAACVQNTAQLPAGDIPAENNEIATQTEQAVTKPLDGWTLHIDAKRHFTDDLGDPIAHHYCKPVANAVTQCLLFASDAADAQMVGVEVIVGPDTYATFTAEEKKRWHYHKDEIPKVDPVMPDLSAEEAAEVAKSIEETYGKIYVLHNPAVGADFVGMPYVTELE